MPELPEVETIRRGLAPLLEGARINAVTLRRPDLRFAFPEHFARRLEGQTITGTGRRAKYLLFTLSGGETWLTHLGMSGSYHVRQSPLLVPSRYRPASGDKHAHVVIRVDHGAHGALELVYTDARRFGFMDLYGDEADCRFLVGLGPEPLGNGLSAPALALRLAGRRAPIKALMLDQRVIAGLGNIYVCEALHRAGIAPDLPAGALVRRNGVPAPALERLVEAIRAVLADALEAGGSTLRDFRHADGTSGYFQHAFRVYDRAGEACPRPGCAGTIARIVQSGRSTYFCPVCQPRTPARQAPKPVDA